MKICRRRLGRPLTGPSSFGSGEIGLIIGPAISSGGNCLIHSLAHLIYNKPYDGDINRAERRCAELRAKMRARHGRPRGGPLGLSTWWAPALECDGRRPGFYTAICVESVDSGARHNHGAGRPLPYYATRGISLVRSGSLTSFLLPRI